MAPKIINSSWGGHRAQVRTGVVIEIVKSSFPVTVNPAALPRHVQRLMHV
jgi:hypothetical protein